MHLTRCAGVRDAQEEPNVTTCLSERVSWCAQAFVPVPDFRFRPVGLFSFITVRPLVSQCNAKVSFGV